jgi:hypothetical protein
MNRPGNMKELNGVFRVVCKVKCERMFTLSGVSEVAIEKCVVRSMEH